ncbi:hypothetical protein VaNZ11_000152 [Volvox africanus]|uniref:SAC domain-containing protein n=1 Tax=Volvox africanus TaxID=51714 RepID=A0ABQ5RLA1_9CHLO|nr:hypothetical protein VaNZ11_000152 [Volvox africanus]
MDSQEIPYQRLSIYQTKARLYIVGYCKLRGTAALLKISKQEPTQLDVAEVVGNYSLDEIRAMLSQIHMANAHLGGLQLVTHCCGIIGCFRFTETYYLLLVTRKAHVGSLCGGHKVYTVAATALVPLHPGYQAAAAAGQPSGAAEKRYVKLLMGMDLTKHFYFSYSYNLTATVQQNCRMAQQRGEQPHLQTQGANPPDGSVISVSPSVYESMFTWNAYLTSALRWALSGNPRWTVPLIHGFWEQRRLSIYGRPLTLTLIARRSRHFAGTRYRKRGINDGGKVANEVETEQVVDVGIDYRTRTPLLSSVVQVRGSVPLFWSQQLTALSPKPEIILQQFDPLYEVTEAHFSDLEARYGSPVVVFNLLKSKERRPREVLLRRELATAIAQLNAQRGRSRPHIVYIPWDFSKHAKQSGANLLSEIAAITRLTLDMTGLFVHNPNAPVSAPVRSSGGASLTVGLGFASPRAGNRGSGGGAPGSSRPGVRMPMGSLRRAAGDGGSSMHLAAAAEAAAAAVRARHATAAMLLSRGSGGGTLSSGISSPPPTARPSLDYHNLRRTSNAHSFGSSGGSGGSLSATQWQSGVLRTNCIDCLDRTNVAQFAFGLVAFGRQLYKLGLHDVRDIDGDSSAAFTLMALYEAMGHVLSLQYGGSEAHTIVFQRKKGEWEAATQSKDFVTSIKRLYSNTYTDAEKQDAINLFLGNFVPMPHQPHLWQLDTDQYLHSETTLRPAPPPSLLRSSRSSTVLAPTTPALPVSWCSSERSFGLMPPFDEPTSPTVMVGPAAPARPPQSRFDFARASSDWTAMATVAAAAAALGASPDNESASVVAAAVSSSVTGGGARFPGLPPESTPLPLELSSDDDDDSRSRSYRDLSGPDVDAAGSLGAGQSSSAAAASGAAAYASAAIPFHRAPSNSNFFTSLLPAMGRGGGGSSSSGPGLFERVVTSLLQPGGAGAAARSAAAGVAGGDVAGGGGRPGRQLVSFDQALARPPNQVWPILLHGEEDKQGRWAAVQSAFSFFWTSNAVGGASDGSTRMRNNYQLDDAPRPQVRHSQTALPARLSTPLSPTPSGTHTPLSPTTSMPLSPDPSRHGGAASASANAAAGGGGAANVVSRALTVGTDGGMSVMSDGSPRSPARGLVTAAVAAAAAEGPPGSRSQSLKQILDAMVDVDHMDQHHGRDTTCRTVAETIPALGGTTSGDAGPAVGGPGSADEDDAAYYYSAGDGEAAAAAASGQLDGAGGARQGVRKMLSGPLLNPTVQPIAFVGGSGKQNTPGSAIPVLNDFIEVIGGPASYITDWRCLGEGHTLDPVVRRRAVAEAAAKAREEERQRKLVTAGLEVNDILALGLEDLGLNWELQPWWALEPRPHYVPRPYEPQPGLLLNVVPAHERELRGGQRGEDTLNGQEEPGTGQEIMRVETAVLDADFTPLESSITAVETATAEAAAPGGYTPTPSYILPYEPPPVHALQRKQQVEHMAFVHFDVAQTHARDKFGNFLGSIAQPYGLYGEERRRDIAMYDALCYIEQR